MIKYISNSAILINVMHLDILLLIVSFFQSWLSLNSHYCYRLPPFQYLCLI